MVDVPLTGKPLKAMVLVKCPENWKLDTVGEEGWYSNFFLPLTTPSRITLLSMYG
jgi:hypothetical protein